MPGIGTITAAEMFTEQAELKGRTTDPTNAEPGEYWVRVDQTSSNPQVVAELRRQDTSGVTKIPLFAGSEESNLGSDMVRGPSVVLDDGTVGFVAQTTDSGAEIGSPRVVTASGTEYLSHNSLTLTTIPDSEIWLSAQEETASDEATLTTISNQGKSGATGDATATSGDATFNASGGAQNSQPYYNINNAKFEFNISTTSPSGFAIYLVYSNANDPTNTSGEDQFKFAATDNEHWPYTDGKFYISTGDGSRYVGGVAGNDTTGTNVVKIIGDGNGITPEQNTGGSTLTLGTSSTTSYSFSDPVIIGSEKSINAELYELIFYTKYPNSTKRQEVDDYINNKYNTAL